MTRKTTHVVPHPDGWAVKSGGTTKAHRVTKTQAEAEKIARQVSINKKGEMLVHGKNGQIRKASSHGNDPCPPKDKA
ncbi:DUF2188 domain-containing protein [Vibrio crassostreae]|uniref:DUF2188 domain-containing protein n=1 Tax=Vibrio crassostreae TaxID=246167 RepID=UPI001B3089A1|nr:DUF2188 domain-containing protein [Vibrio crassostreae]